MNSATTFENDVAESISRMSMDNALIPLTHAWVRATSPHKYTYHFKHLGRPIIQFPQDIVAIQEIIWTVRPDLIIETGIAHGGSLILSASMLCLLDYSDAARTGATLNPRECHRRVLGIDIDIRAHNRSAIEAHPMAHRIDMIEGSSIDPGIIARVREHAAQYKRVMIILDSNHTHDHVLKELEAYAPLTSHGSYCIVFDTAIEDLPDTQLPERPWGKGNNPKTAVWEYQRRLREEGRTATDGSQLSFEIDKVIEDKLLITVAPDGYLKRI